MSEKTLVLVARARRATHELRQPPVERRLAALEARAHGPARAGLLAAHAEATRRALAGGDAAALAHLALRGTGRGLDVVHSELRRADDRRRGAALADEGGGQAGRR